MCGVVFWIFAGVDVGRVVLMGVGSFATFT
jgi:hypothetical protein